MNVDPKWVESLGKPLTMAAAKFEIGATATTDPLEGPKREFSIEVLREEPNSLYLEMMSQWTQFPSMEALQMNKVRPIDRTASEYLNEAMGFLKNRISSLGQEMGVQNE